MSSRLLYILLGLLAGCTVYSGSSKLPAGIGTPSQPTSYRTIAILPIQVTQVQLRGFTSTGQPDTTAATRLRIGRRGEKLAYQLQTALATQLRAKQPATKYAVWLQPIRETNLRLQQTGITYKNLARQSPAHLQEVLGVDALLTGQTLISKLPLSVALATGLLLPTKLGHVPTTLATTSLNLQDPRSDQPTWQTSFSTSHAGQLAPGGFSELANRVMQTMPPTFPYR
jgi:hypothetical protein